MGLRSGIEWTEATWNPVTGCNKVSPGCKHCYAERIATRLQAMGHQAYRQGFDLTLQPQKITLPLHWKKPHTIFVNSMSDLFHEAVPLEYIQQVFDVMGRANWHRFQVLTKRAARLRELDVQLPWEPHIWMGVSVEKRAYVSRIDDLRQTHAHIKFLSLEPLLGPLLHLDLRDIDWVIVGGSLVHVHVLWNRNGSWRFEISVARRVSLSSSNNGGARIKKRQAGFSKDRCGMKCLQQCRHRHTTSRNLTMNFAEITIRNNSSSFPNDLGCQQSMNTRTQAGLQPKRSSV